MNLKPKAITYIPDTLEPTDWCYIPVHVGGSCDNWPVAKHSVIVSSSVAYRDKQV